MPNLSSQLILNSCPHCGRANPTLVLNGQPIGTDSHNKNRPRFWGVYSCNTCGGLVIAGGKVMRQNNPFQSPIQEIYPSVSAIDDSIPEKPREFLRQAKDSFHAASGAIMLCASAVDAMLKEKKYKKGTLYARIDKAVEDHLITNEMAKWAHQVRLDANDQRHADDDAPLPAEKDAKLAFDFAIAFAEYLFVLPSKVSSGIDDTIPIEKATKDVEK